MTTEIREPELRKSIAARLITLRAEIAWSQQSVAKEIGITQAAMSNYENGKRETPLWVALRLCGVYGISIEDLIA